MALDENKAKVYEIIFNMILKAFLCLAAVVAFFIVLFKLLDAKTTFDSWKYGLIETFLTCCIFSVSYTHLDVYKRQDRKVIDIVKSTTTDYTDVIVKHLSSEYVISTYDINKGIKHLWEKDKIDSRYAKWKKDKSTTTETMDEDYTLKKHYHAIYLDLIKSPLNKMVFKYLLGDGVFCDHFSADPSSGQISIPLYPGNANQITNVINEILANN